MKILPNFPQYASGNCDFVTGTTRLDEGDRVVVLDKRAEALPNGILCINSRTVDMIVKKIGWRLFTDEDAAELFKARHQLADALERIEALEQIVDGRARLEALS